MPADPMLVQAIDILLVEDSPADVRLTREALQDSKLINRLTVARDGIEALAALRKQGSYASAPQPDLILLDLNLPRKNGRAVLEEIKQDSDLRRIPVVIVTSSAAEEDIVRSYDLHANCYIVKPIELGDFMRVVKAIEDFWVGIVKLPPK
jgi:CheY-like chemotaxis protein